MSSLTQSLSGLFCSSLGQRKLLVERQSNEKENYQHSRLHNLPAEILFKIGSNVPGLALTSLRQTCRKFDATFNNTGYILYVEKLNTSFYYNPPDFSNDDLTEHRLALRRDFYYRKCERERERSPSSSLLCSSCQQKHSRSNFTDDQIAADPAVRVCKAAETGGLQSCNHLVMPFFSLQRLRIRDSVSSSTFGALSGRHGPHSVECPAAIGLHFCTERRRREFFHPTLGCDLTSLSTLDPMRYSEPWSYKLVLQYSVLQLSVGQDAHVSVIADKIRTLMGDICPHIRMNGMEVLRSIYPGTFRAALFTTSTVRWMNDWHSSYADLYRWSKICSCKQPNCDTKFRFALDKFEEDRQKVHLVVQRDLGRLEDPNDLKWLAQRVVPMGYAP